MSAINDGGPAFPTFESNGEGHLYCSGAGMSLRDYFAAKALQGLLAGSTVVGSCEPYAVVAYRYADAMLKAREGIE